jgi:hypothetical protein
MLFRKRYYTNDTSQEIYAMHYQAVASMGAILIECNTVVLVDILIVPLSWILFVSQKSENVGRTEGESASRILLIVYYLKNIKD